MPRSAESARRRRAPKQKIPKAQLRAAGICGAMTKTGGWCQLKSGYGTTHPGIGRCKYHGGANPNNKKAAIKKEAVEFMGAPIDINPLDAIIWCIKITAGEVQWLSDEIAKVTEEEWYEHTVVGKQMHILQRARADAQDRLVRYSKDAISLGLAERAIRLAEQFGSTIARLLEGIQRDLVLTPEQAQRWPLIVRKHLIIMEGGKVIETDAYNKPLYEIAPKSQIPMKDRIIEHED